MLRQDSVPTYEKVRELPTALEQLVPEEYCDANGHMNVRSHLGLHDDASWVYFGWMGFGERYIEHERRSFFDLEHHLRYFDEVLAGDAVSVHWRLMARSTKLVHAMSFLVDVTRERVANTLEVMSAHVDLDTRRTTPFDGPTADALDRQIEIDDKLSWPAPLCGALSLR